MKAAPLDLRVATITCNKTLTLSHASISRKHYIRHVKLAGRMRSHCLFYAARNDLLDPYTTENFYELCEFTVISCKIPFHYGKICIVFVNIYKESIIKSVWEHKGNYKFLQCGPQIDFWLLKLNMRPERWFEFDMPALHIQTAGDRRVI